MVDSNIHPLTFAHVALHYVASADVTWHRPREAVVAPALAREIRIARCDTSNLAHKR